jgi:hypothetical protein
LLPGYQLISAIVSDDKSAKNGEIGESIIIACPKPRLTSVAFARRVRITNPHYSNKMGISVF